MAVKGQATKNRLMDIAEQLILNNGFSAMSIDDVIKEAGITKGGFFYHFDSKNTLAYALMQRYGKLTRTNTVKAKFPITCVAELTAQVCGQRELKIRYEC